MKIIMIVPSPEVKGGIASVIKGYRQSNLEQFHQIVYLQSYCNGGRFSKFIKAIKSYILFVYLIFTNKPDLIHIHSSFGPSFYRKIPFIILGKFLKILIINHIHGAEFDKFYTNAGFCKKILVKKIYNKCSYIIVLSKEWKNLISNFVNPQNIFVLENYCVVPNKVLWEQKNPNQILFLGEIGRRKGCYDILKIMEIIRDFNVPIKIIIAGDGETENICKLIKAKGLSQYTEFPGWVTKEIKEHYLQKSSIFLLPSYHEGMPMSILEAMGYGLVVISTDVGGIPDFIFHNNNGFLYKPGDVNSMANKIVQLLNNPEEIEEVGKKAQEFVANHYDLKHHVDKLLKIYNFISARFDSDL